MSAIVTCGGQPFVLFVLVWLRTVCDWQSFVQFVSRIVLQQKLGPLNKNALISISAWALRNIKNIRIRTHTCVKTHKHTCALQTTSGGGTPTTYFAATMTATIGTISAVAITSNGYGYSSNPSLVITYPETVACATTTTDCKSTPQTHSVVGVTVTAAGSKYINGRVRACVYKTLVSWLSAYVRS